MSRRAAAALALALTLTVVGLVPGQASAATLDAGEADLLTLVNAFRASRGLSTLTVSDSLTAAAKWMAIDMSVNDYFAHTSLDGRSPQRRMADAGYPAYQTWTGENLAAGYTSASQVLSGWIASPGHLAVLTNPNYRAIGLGRAYRAGSSWGWYWTMDVGGIVDAAGASSSMDHGFHAQWAGQSPDVAVAPGQVTTLVVALKNTGHRGWYRGSPGQQATLGTAAPLDVARSDVAYGWISNNRITTTTTDYVGPGQVGWFQFQIRAPQARGLHRLHVRGVIDGTTWLEDPGIYFTIEVR